MAVVLVILLMLVYVVWFSLGETGNRKIKATIEADCPLDYAAISGGYDTGKGVYLTLASKPNQAFDGVDFLTTAPVY